MSEKEKQSAWDFALALIQFDNLKPSRDMLELSKKEVKGQITLQQILETLNIKYGVKSEI